MYPPGPTFHLRKNSRLHLHPHAPSQGQYLVRVSDPVPCSSSSPGFRSPEAFRHQSLQRRPRLRPASRTRPLSAGLRKRQSLRARHFHRGASAPAAIQPNAFPQTVSSLAPLQLLPEGAGQEEPKPHLQQQHMVGKLK